MTTTPDTAAPAPDTAAPKPDAANHRSLVRPIVTYAAAGYLFLFVPLAAVLFGSSLKDWLQELFLLPVPLAGAIITYWFATRPTDKHLDRVLDRFAQAAENAATQAEKNAKAATEAQESANAAQEKAEEAAEAAKKAANG